MIDSHHDSFTTLSPVTQSNYIGRFAPSPSGPLHIGSLTCALASYLDAKANNGKWLIRIEDIDPPREQKGADKLILSTLEAHGLFSDNEIRYQSQRTNSYLSALSYFEHKNLSYRCSCTRKRLNTLSGSYDGYCRSKPPRAETPSATRLRTDYEASGASGQIITFTDLIQNKNSENLQLSGDFIIHRKDGLFAYQLAVSIDDADQNISNVVRGCDLLEATAKQIFIIKMLGGIPPQYAHIPVVVSEPGKKLSKQNHAQAIRNEDAALNLSQAFRALDMQPPRSQNLTELLSWGVTNWDIQKLNGKREVLLDSLVSSE